MTPELLDAYTSGPARYDEMLAALKKFWNGKELNMPLEIVIGTGIRP